MNKFLSKVIKLIKTITKAAQKLKLVVLKNSILLTWNSVSQHSHKFKNSTFLEFKKGSLIIFLSGERALFLQV